MRFVVSFFAVLMCTFASPVYGNLRAKITKECGQRPPFTKDTNEAITKVGNALNLRINSGFDRCHTLSFQIIRKEVCDLFPADGTPVCATKVNNWRVKMDTLNDALHTIDTEWIHYKDLKKNGIAYGEFENTNKKNKDKVTASLDDVIKHQGSSDGVLASKIKAVMVYMNSATANLRPGHASVNRAIGGHLDPLLKVKTSKIPSTKAKLILTSNSIAFERNYPTTWKVKAGSIMTSDNM
ncbi:uncharacterized protein LOC130626018 [Hydractinia symbiolongicarpus]|uniref:uncharacterized protein LOC130626018 n=1 Tax=Hydractinia symbiolongicarpus TaxID=13093 RepID=UPI00254F9150|nr:uncharacterized protein LOC130626018 [Hydractinia symbiolongicarpus]